MKSRLRFVGPILIALAAAMPTHAQDAASPKFTVFAGPGILATQGHSKGEFQAGASFEEAPPGAWAGFSLEGGYLGPWSRPKSGSAFFSADYMASWSFGQDAKAYTSNGKPFWCDRGWKLLPFASAGYTRLVGTGNAVNFGGGVDYRLNNQHAIRVEVRDYYSPSSPGGHNVGFRVGWVIYIRD